MPLSTLALAAGLALAAEPMPMYSQYPAAMPGPTGGVSSSMGSSLLPSAAWQGGGQQAPAPVVPAVPGTGAAAAADVLCEPAGCRSRFASDRAFDCFIAPMTNIFLNFDPRSQTSARFVYLHNSIPGQHVLGGGTASIYALQLSVALSERLSFIANRNAIATIDPRNAASETGIMNFAGGLKYTFWRDVECQRVAAVGFTYEAPTGYANIQQNHGGGLLNLFSSGGMQIGDSWHFLSSGGIQIPFNDNQNSTFTYTSLHIDKCINGWFYPLAELNYFYYLGGANRFPRAFGEGDGLWNFGTQNMNKAQLVTTAVGFRALLTDHASLGATYEIPISNRKDFINERITVDFTLRF